MIKINNASSSTLNKAVNTNLPNVSAAVVKWFQPMSFFKVTKTTVAYQESEEMVETKTMGTWQPLKPREVSYKPEGQRAFSWFRLHALPDFVLEEDEVVIKDGVQYRVKGFWPYNEYGYVEYHMYEDYSGRGPEIVSPT